MTLMVDATLAAPLGGRSPGSAGAILLALVALLAPASLPASPYGVNVHLPSPAVLDAAAAAGATWIRVDFLWSLVEPGRGVFHWEPYDEIVDAAAARGLHVYASIGDTPAWATDGPAGSGAPRDAADFYDFCYRAAARYRGRISHWGMWNEPNDQRFWAGSRDAYVDEILIPGADAVHAADPSARVCGPELANLQSLDWDRWLRDVLRRAGDRLDVVTHHLYPDGASAKSVIDQLDRGSRYPWDPPSVRKVLSDNGWGGRPVWLTETGCASGSVGEAAQAAFVGDLLAGLFGTGRSMSWVDKVFFYELADDPRYPGGLGLLGTPPEYVTKAAYLELQRDTASLSVDDAEVVAVEVPSWLAPGAAATASVTLRNTGTTTWSGAAGDRLAAGDDADPLAAVRHDLAAGESVAPGATATFAFDVTAPAVATPPGQPLRSAWRMIREGAWRFGEAAVATVAVSASAPGVTSYLPFAEGRVDDRGRSWATDLVLHNRGTTPLSARVALLLPGEDGANARTISVTVAPGAITTIADVVRSRMGSAGPGVLRVEADSADLLAAGRTSVTGSGGAFAAFAAATPASAAVPPGGAGRILLLSRGAQALGARSDLVLANGGDVATSTEVDLLGPGGAALGGTSVELAARGVALLGDVLADVAPGGTAAALAAVRPSPSGGGVLAWALTSDGRSGDPSIAGVEVPQDGPFLLAPVDATSRLRGGSWRTAVQLVAGDDAPADVTVTLMTPAGQGPAVRDRRLTIPGTAGLASADALGEWFSYRSSGALLVTPLGGAVAGAGVTALSRTPAPYGVSFGAVPAGLAAAEAQGCRLFPITRVADVRGTRTHVAIANLDLAPVFVDMRVFDAAGTQLRSFTLRVGAGEWRQFADVLKPITTLNGQSCYAVLRSSLADARFLAYATIADGDTGDLVAVPCV